eukprot:CAMPEP_0197475326 /NCGR_PEP_ID=MMETSP1309-20131121/6786_1 /TAXON_ID=464262 /ORGANISM="Genus nov. species nov., Strain RCC998" /LENGTH=388 /DNA_ID=CAMNT_0043015323 /DNA_START=166 /DNA_END=1329 /DNA_ORIENTATION=+
MKVSGNASGGEGGGGDAGEKKASTSNCSLFWDEEQPDDFENHPDFVAMQAAMEEYTPFEEAEAWKNQGNDRLRMARKAAHQRMKRKFQREAAELYTRAIRTGSKDPETPNSFLGICFNNRAQVNILLTNFRSALEDAEEAIKLLGGESASKKAYFRAVKAALALKDIEKARALGRTGLPLAKGDKEYSELMEEIEKVDKEVKAEEEKESEEADKSLSTAVQFAILLKQRSVKLGFPSFPDIQNKPYLDEDGLMHWPVIMIYPESGQVEFIEDFPEDSTFEPFMDMMFQDDVSAFPWDVQNEYTKSRISLYYSSSYSEVMPQDKLFKWLDGNHVGEQDRTWKKESWEKISPKATLASMLRSKDCIIPGLPTIYAVSDNDFLAKFLSGDW